MKHPNPRAALIFALLSPVAFLSAVPASAQESESTAPAQVERAPAPERAKEARIPFVSNIRDYRADGDRGIYLRSGRQWYHGTFFGPCIDLPFAWRIGFRPSTGIGGIDRFSSVVIPGKEECRLNSLVKIDGTPPPSAKRIKQNKAAKGSDPA